MSLFEEMLAKVKEQQAVPAVDEVAEGMGPVPGLRKDRGDDQQHGHDRFAQHGDSDVNRAEEEESESKPDSNVAKSATAPGLSQREDRPKPVPRTREDTDFPEPPSVPVKDKQARKHPRQSVEVPDSTTVTHRTSRSGTGELAFLAGLAFAHSAEETAVKRFPKTLVESLRSLLGGQTGHSFAKECSAAQLLTAFVVAQLGTNLDGLDENTAKAVAAFQAMEPRLGAIEDGVTGLDEQVDRIVAGLTGMAGRLESVEKSIRAVELGHAFVLADRFVAFRTHGMTETTAEIDHPKALTMRETLRRQAEAQHKLQRQRDGRSY
ncbi:hypothetical protein [Nocardiopsis synnemataformans]|uniref:hypothetical protein n=1 Tax=Nocardiopsis synnemataformans TaxID=61305 RepID=UPI003EB8011E